MPNPTSDSLMPFSTAAKKLMRCSKATVEDIKKEKEQLAAMTGDHNQSKATEIKADDVVNHIAAAMQKKQNDSKAWSDLANSLAAAAKLDSTIAEEWNTICQERDEKKQRDGMLKLLKEQAYIDLFKKYQSQILPRARINTEELITSPMQGYSKMTGGDFEQNYIQDGYQSDIGQFVKHTSSLVVALAETFFNLLYVALGSKPVFLNEEDKKNENNGQKEVVRFLPK